MRAFTLVMVVAGLACFLPTLSSVACADLVELQNGGIVRGQLEQYVAGAQAALSPLRIQTLSGARVEFFAESVREVTRRRVVVEEFELKLQTTADEVAPLWDLAEWCREKSLREQRQQLLTRIVELDPEHVAAHRGLGHIQQHGEWTTQEAVMLARGYVKHKGKWLLPQELALTEQEEANSAEEKTWFRQIKMWRGWLDDTVRPERPAEALVQLRAIQQPTAVPAVCKLLGQDPREAVRLLAMEILSRIEGEACVPALISQVLRDESLAVRNAAITILRTKDRRPSVSAFTRALKHDLNVVVNRAAVALGRLADAQSVPALIEALVTEHRYRVQVQDPQSTVGYRSDGNMVPTNVPILPPDIAGLLATGQLPQGVNVQQAPLPGDNMRLRDVLVLRKEQNSEVLNSLVAITGQNYGYDKDTWKLWLRQQNLRPVKNVK